MAKTRRHIFTLFFVSLLSLLIGIFFLQSPMTASANTASEFYMIDGAAVRIAETVDESGIRFMAKVPQPTEETKEREYRMLIVPAEILSDNNITADYVNALKKAYPNYADEFTTYFYDVEVTPFEDTNAMTNYGWVVSAAMKTILPKNYVVEFSGIAYYMDGETPVYANFTEGTDIQENARSVAYVASAALNDTKVTYTDKKAETLAGYVDAVLKNGEPLIDETDEEIALDAGAQTVNVNATTKLDLTLSVADTTVASIDNEKDTYSPTSFGYTEMTATIGAQYTCLDGKYAAVRSLFIDGADRDAALQKYVVSLGDDAHKNYSCNLAYENVKYEGQTVISKPEGLDSTSFAKYGVTLKSTSFGRQFGMPIQFAGEIDKRYIDTENIDWSTAYIGFWVNTDFSNQPEGTTLGFFLLNDAIKTSGTNATTLPAEVDYVTSGEWTYVELSLANYASLIISGESYTLDVCWVYNSKVEKTDFNETIYIDGVSVYNKQIDTISALANYCVEKGTDIYKYAYGQASVSVKNYDSSMEKPEEGWTKETYLQYDVTALSGSTNIYTLPINIVSGGKYALSSETKTDVNVTDWTTAYVGLWVYNDSDVDLTIHALQSDSSTAFNATALATIKKGSWTYVEIALSSFNITENVFDTNSYNFKLYAAYKGTGYNSTTETDENYYGNFSARYCIGSFEIYNK